MFSLLAGGFGTIIAQDHAGCKHHKQNFHSFFKSQQRAVSFSVSDSIDLIKHTIYLDLTDFDNNTTKSSCSIDFEALVDNISELPLDLKEQEVDSVTHSSGLLNFTYQGELLTIELPNTLSAGMSDQVTVHYRGGAVTDPSGFGGFYFNNNIAYNIGVAFSDWPASYGRSWFPCFDNFVEKSIYEYQVLTSNGKSAYCNGYLQSTDTLSGDTVLTTWILDHEISSYLASVAVSDYELTEWAFNLASGDTIPVFLASQPSNTAGLTNAFQNLETVFNAFEGWFGDYRWPKVGYTVTPVGAMEHSTNIAFPTSLASPGFQSESVMAHELAHEWFGNLVTCADPKDMWLNEGWAEFCSILAYEAIDNEEEYISQIRSKHRDMLHKAHYLDGGFLTMNDIPQDATYGEHVYNKGALMTHTLRSYLGDDVFFPAMTDYLNTFEYGNASSEDLRDFLNNEGILVTDYFDDWIFQPGWAQFSVDNITTTPGDVMFLVSLEINQRLREAPDFYHNVPVTVSLYDENWNVHEEQIVIGGENTQLEVIAPFEPIYVTLNRDDKLSWAVTAQEVVIEAPGFDALNHAFANLLPQTVDAPATLRVEKNWVGPGGSVSGDYVVSPDRYWRIGGVFSDNFECDIRFEFDARNTSNGNLDVKLFELAGENFNENDLKLLYRSHPSENWTVWEDVTLNTLGPTDNGYARLTAHNLALGEYTFGYTDPNVGIDEETSNQNVKLFPNPAQDQFRVQFSEQPGPNTRLIIISASGKIIQQKELNRQTQSIEIGSLTRGNYLIEIRNGEKVIDRQQIVVQ